MKPINLRAAEVIEALETGRVTVRQEMRERPPEWVQAISYNEYMGEWRQYSYQGALTMRPLGSEPPWSPGDKLWVRECWSTAYALRECCASALSDMAPIHYWADGDLSLFDWCRPKPSQHMPRWASRITLITRDVRAEKNEETGRFDWVGEMERVDE